MPVGAVGQAETALIGLPSPRVVVGRRIPPGIDPRFWFPAESVISNLLWPSEQPAELPHDIQVHE